MKRVFLLLLVVLLIVSACSKKKQDTGQLVKKAILVEVQNVERGVFGKYLKLKGTVFPWRQANIGPETSGRIWKIYKKQGDLVSEGTLLAELETTTLKLQLKQAQAAVEVAQAGYKDAKINSERLTKLREKNAVSQMQLEKAVLALEASETEKASAEANLNVVKHILKNSYMKAPFQGIITSKNMEEGDMINPMMGMGSSVLTLMDLNKVKIVIHVPAEDIEQIRVGQDCIVGVSSRRGEAFKGTVYTKNLAADPVSKTFKVEIQIENPGTKILAGVFAEVAVEIYRNENILLLPVSALIDNNYVVVYDDGKAKHTPVTIGAKNDQYAELLEGLDPGQQVVVVGNYDLKDGSEIAVREEGK